MPGRSPLPVDPQAEVAALRAETTRLAAELDRLRLETETLRVEGHRREAAEKALAASEERHRAFIAASSEAIWRVELEEPLDLALPDSAALDHALGSGYIAECNDAMARMYGYERASDFVGTRLSSILDRDDPKNLAMLQGMLRSGMRLEDAETSELDRDGNMRVFLNNLVGVVEDGKLVRVWGTQRDVTDRRRFEEELRQAAKLEGLGRLAAGLAHDFNNLLTAIVGHAEMAEERVDQGCEALLSRITGGSADALGDSGAAVARLCDDVKTDIEEVRLAALRASSLTRQLLAFTRKQVTQPVVLDVNQSIARIEKLLRRLLPDDVEIVFDPSVDLWPVLADGTQVEQVLMNLAVNARDAMPGGGRLHIRTQNVTFPGDDTMGFVGDHVLVSVSDTGAGMDNEVRQHLFEPYFTTKEMGQGTGLGLATCHAIVTQSGGRIEVASLPQRGTTFRVYLPRCEGRPEASSTTLAPPSPAGTETVLVVEDEAAVRSLAVRFLKSRGYDVLEAGNGQEALAVAAAHAGKIDLLVTDMVMPRMGGVDLARRLREARPDLQVLLTSGFSEQGLDARADSAPSHFLAKPYALIDLARRVRQVLDGES